MKWPRRWLVRALLGGAAVITAWPRVARAALDSLSKTAIDLRYRMTTAGILAAVIGLTIDPDEDGLDARLVFEARGVMRFLRGKRILRFALDADRGAGGFVPRRFTFSETKPDRERGASLRYDAEGRLAETGITSRGRDKPVEVPDALREGAVDPLTALLRVREWLAGEPERGAELELALLDGRKRGDLSLTYRGRSTLTLGERTWPIHRADGILLARFGYEREDPLISFPGEAPNVLDMRFSADAQVLPLLLTTEQNGLATRIVVTSL